MSLDITLYLNADTGDGVIAIPVFDTNITHNLVPMARIAGLYLPMWDPEPGDRLYCGNLIPKLEAGLAELKRAPDIYREHNPKNGWGSYEVLIDSTQKYLDACRAYPKASISAHR